MSRLMQAGALAQLKVLDFTQLLPGPFCSLLLAEMGAEVIKIEPPGGEAMRRMSLLGGAPGAAFAYLNRNKQSQQVNLKMPDQAAKIRAMIQTDGYDIVIEGFRPGVMNRLGLDYPSLQALNPRLIYCSISGYGQHSSVAGEAGHDITYISRAGVAALTGQNAEPMLPGVQLADLSGAYQAVIAILAAVIQRQQTGTGQGLDISLTQAAFSLASVYAAEMAAGEQVPEMGQMPLSGGDPCYRFYRCSDDRYLAVGALEQVFRSRLAARLGVELDQKSLEACFAARPRDAWCELLADCDACVVPVLSLAEVLASPVGLRPLIEVGGLLQPGPVLPELSGPLRPAQPG